jgi:hypothetical protein
MQDFEKLGAFYLGKRYDLEQQKVSGDLLLYDAKDLTTHAICVGMTGSGKTGLCLSLLEEAAIDGIPAIAIDPKGDLSNLLLTFPKLQPADFRPWIDPAEATRKGLSPDEMAAQTAKTWREGLAEWGQDGARITRFRQAADVAVYTPASNAGLPLAALKSLAAPPAAIRDDADALRERIVGTVSGLAALVGIDGDPLRSRECILLSNIVERAWKAGRDLQLGDLVREIQTPSFDKVGFMDLESFYPAKERFQLSLMLNNCLASPGFSAWLEGEPLDIARLLHTPEGKPRLSILSISHLSDHERTFFVTLLLHEVIARMRSQSGTSSLRAILYMDEIFGFFPPSANPPTKPPMLTLLKQARAFGLGIVLATQNPVDLDYKGLSNTGTWFLGRLQTERDKARVLDGLEGATSTAGRAFDRAKTEAILSGLPKRTFLMNNVHDDAPEVFQTRWTLSYLRGPLTRDQIHSLMAEGKQAAAAESPSASSPRAPSAPAAPTGEGTARPVLPPGIPEFFQPPIKALPAGGSVCYRPALLGVARVHYAQASTGVDAWEDVRLLVDAAEGVPDPVWDAGDPLADEPDLESAPIETARFADLASELSRAKNYATWTTALKDALYRTRRLTLWKCPALKEVSAPGESEVDFRVRLSQSAKERRDLDVEKLRAKYAPKLAAAEDKLRRALAKVEREKAQATDSTFQAAITVGTSILGAMFGRKLASSANVGRAATSARAASRAARQRADIGDAAESVEVLRERRDELDAQFQAEAEQLERAVSPAGMTLEEIVIPPKKSDITVSRVVLVWRPA